MGIFGKHIRVIGICVIFAMSERIVGIFLLIVIDFDKLFLLHLSFVFQHLRTFSVVVVVLGTTDFHFSVHVLDRYEFKQRLFDTACRRIPLIFVIR